MLKHQTPICSSNLRTQQILRHIAKLPGMFCLRPAVAATYICQTPLIFVFHSPEIWRDTGGGIDILVSGIGTGGTISGVSHYIKGSKEHGLEAKKQIHTVAVEPMEQMLLTAARGGDKIGPQGPHKIQGMGAGFVPPILDLDVIDQVVPVHSDQAMSMANELWMQGLPVGASSGAIVQASVDVLRERPKEMCVCVIPSFGERYFTHPMFQEIAEQAKALEKEPLPEPYDNTEYGFATPRG